MTALPKHYYTPAEYLALEREAEYKSEYLDGQIYAMAGASVPHIAITFKIGNELYNKRRDRECRVYTSEMRVKIAAGEAYYYPDVVALCDKPVIEDKPLATLTNPAVIFEVLSPSTEAYDRGKKFAQYRRIESLTDYLLVAQDEMRVEHYTRQGKSWVLTEFLDPTDTITLPTLGVTLDLATIYEDVDFTATPA